MNPQVQQFRKLHQLDEPLLVGNVWNVESVRVFERQQYKAIATSSAAVAETLGYKDGEQMPFSDYFFIIKRMIAVAGIPLSVDLETGYGKTTDDIIQNIQQLQEIGVAGINLEDSIINGSQRTIDDADHFAVKLERIVSVLRNEHIGIFINIRCDAFLLNLPDARNEAIKRIKLYEKKGIDGIFLPCIADIDDIKATVTSTQLPVNVMCIPGLPDFDLLKVAGVKRISMGPFLKNAVYGAMDKFVETIGSERDFSCLFPAS